MLKQLFLMYYAQGHSEALTEKSIRQARILDDKFVADETFPHIVLCASSPAGATDGENYRREVQHAPLGTTR